MCEGWTGFNQVKVVQEFENKIKPMPFCIHSFWVLSFLNRVTAYLREKNCSQYHDIYREKVKHTRNDTSFEI